MAKPLHVNVIENLWQHVLKKDPQWFERQAGATPLHPDPHHPDPQAPPARLPRLRRLRRLPALPVGGGATRPLLAHACPTLLPRRRT